MRLRQLPLVTHGNSSRKWEMLVSVVLYSVMVCCATHMSGNEVSLVIPEDAGLQTDLL